MPGVPVVLGVGGAGQAPAAARRALIAAGIAAAADPRGVAAAAAALLADAQEPGPARPPPRPGARPATARLTAIAPVAARPGPHDEDQAQDTCSASSASPRRRAGPARPRPRRTPALRELGGPVAVKILDAAVLHKTEIGGVILGVRTPDELDAALDTLERAPAPPRYLVERMAPPGLTWCSARAATRCSARCCCSASAASPPRRWPTSPSGWRR